MSGVWCEWKLILLLLFCPSIYIQALLSSLIFFLEDHVFFSELPLSNISCLYIFGFIAIVYSVPLNSSLLLYLNT